jgi:hypothetical protein
MGGCTSQPPTKSGHMWTLKMDAPRIRLLHRNITCAIQDTRFDELLCEFFCDQQPRTTTVYLVVKMSTVVIRSIPPFRVQTFFRDPQKKSPQCPTHRTVSTHVPDQLTWYRVPPKIRCWRSTITVIGPKTTWSGPKQKTTLSLPDSTWQTPSQWRCTSEFSQNSDVCSSAIVCSSAMNTRPHIEQVLLDT